MVHKRRFSYEFRKEVVELSHSCPNIVELANDLNLRPELVYRWRSQFPNLGMNSQTDRTDLKPANQLIENVILKEQVALLKQENQVLKETVRILTQSFSNRKEQSLLNRIVNFFK